MNTRINEWGYPIYDILGQYTDRLEADIALAEYNKSPFDVNRKKITFAEVYSLWYDWKYKNPVKTYSRSSIDCTRGAFAKCQAFLFLLKKSQRYPGSGQALSQFRTPFSDQAHLYPQRH